MSSIQLMVSSVRTGIRFDHYSIPSIWDPPALGPMCSPGAYPHPLPLLPTALQLLQGGLVTIYSGSLHPEVNDAQMISIYTIQMEAECPRRTERYKKKMIAVIPMVPSLTLSHLCANVTLETRFSWVWHSKMKASMRPHPALSFPCYFPPECLSPYHTLICLSQWGLHARQQEFKYIG